MVITSKSEVIKIISYTYIGKYYNKRIKRKEKIKMVISSKENSIIKEVKKLKEKKYRKDKYIIEGYKMLREAIYEEIRIDLVIVTEDFYNVNQDLLKKLAFNKCNYIIVSTNVFKELTDVKTPQGIMAVVYKNKEDSINESARYIMALDDVQDPGNIGTIIRTLDSANIKQLIVSKGTVDAYSPKVVRSTMGAIFRVNVIEVENLKDELDKLKQKGFKIVSTSLQTDKSIYDINYDKKVVVIGNEANGVSKEIQDNSDIKVKIPMLGKTESLNASVAASIMIYEYVRQSLDK